MNRYLITGLCFALLNAKAALALDAGALKAATDGWNTLLSQYVTKTGGVDYRGLIGAEGKLDAFIKAYASMDFKGADDDTKKAAYINLYNATMMHNLLRYAKAEKIDLGGKAFTGLEINSIKVSGGNIWNGDYTVDLAGQKVSLDDIEHKLIRGQAEDGKLAEFKVAKLDPRIHAAVNCAAVSCPRVREVAYRPETVDKLLEENIREYMSSDAQFHKIDGDKLKANTIVYWYYDDFDDFGKKAGKGGAGHYLGQFISASAPDSAWKVKHLADNFDDRSKVSLKLSSAFDFQYDWRVNDVRNKP